MGRTDVSSCAASNIESQRAAASGSAGIRSPAGERAGIQGRAEGSGRGREAEDGREVEDGRGLRLGMFCDRGRSTGEGMCRGSTGSKSAHAPANRARYLVIAPDWAST